MTELSLAELRQRLGILDDPEIDALCLDHFATVYDKFSRGMRKDEKITLLLNHCRKQSAERARLVNILARAESSPTGSLVEHSGATTTRGSGFSWKTMSEPPEIQRRYALLIGVRDYIDPSYRPLPHTVHDVIELEKVLRAAGYTVRTLHSEQAEAILKPTGENIWGELENLARATGPGDLLFVHFAGHGDLAGQQAYLLPYGGRKSSLARTAIDLDEFEQALAGAGAQARILILDACHSGIGRSASGMDEEFERHVYLEATGIATLASCRRGEVAHEHDGSQHGAFTFFLLEGLRGAGLRDDQRFITFENLRGYVTDAVKRWALDRGLQQWPNASTELVGDPPLIVLPDNVNVGADLSSANPFTDILAIRDPVRFVGRGTELKRILEIIRGGSIALVGERKIGKSSLLYRLSELLSERADLAIVFWDFFDPAPVEVLFNRTILALGASGNSWADLKKAVCGRQVVLLLDEFDVAPERGFNLEVLRGCRFLCQHEPGMRIVTASRTLPKEIFPSPGKGSWPYDFLIVQHVGLFSEEEARQLLGHPWAPRALSFDEIICQELIDLVKGHPYLLQRAAYHRYKALGDPTYDWCAGFERDRNALE